GAHDGELDARRFSHRVGRGGAAGDQREGEEQCESPSASGDVAGTLGNAVRARCNADGRTAVCRRRIRPRSASLAERKGAKGTARLVPPRPSRSKVALKPTSVTDPCRPAGCVKLPRGVYLRLAVREHYALTLSKYLQGGFT